MAHREAERHSLGLHTAGFRALLATQFLGTLNVFAFLFFLVSAITEYAAGDAALASRRESLAYILVALPFVLLAGWAGAVTDRYRKSSVLRAAKLVEVAVMGGVVAACVLERGDWLFPLLFALGAQAAFFIPAKHGYLAEMVEERELTRANALAGMSTFLAIIAGHVGGGFLYDRFGGNLPLAAGAFLLVALLGAAACWIVPRTEAAHTGGGLLNPVTTLLATWREVSANRGLLYTVLGIGNFYLMAALLDVQLRTYAEQVLGAGKTLAHSYVALAVLGVAAGALLAARWSERKVELGVVPLGALLMSLVLWSLSLPELQPLVAE
ncbi:MAG TPA: MFS transporter, partial [Candidatus Limnocylindrales bacterium]|nr:MFS transporter [Candidatus Limnocylindrales bacterium]